MILAITTGSTGKVNDHNKKLIIQDSLKCKGWGKTQINPGVLGH